MSLCRRFELGYFGLARRQGHLIWRLGEGYRVAITTHEIWERARAWISAHGFTTDSEFNEDLDWFIEGSQPRIRDSLRQGIPRDVVARRVDAGTDRFLETASQEAPERTFTRGSFDFGRVRLCPGCWPFC